MMTARARRVLPAILMLLLVASASRAAGLPKVPDDLKVRLVASFPDLLYPSQLATSPDGSLFVAVDPMDQVGPYEAMDGKIYLYRDGKDPVIFAEGFRAVFGMAWREGELYVSHMPFLTVLRDTDGDGKADTRKDLFKDLGITNNAIYGLNDHIVSGIQFGIDDRLYISTGDKGVLKATGPDGKTAQVVGGGTLRCLPDGTDLEVFTTGTRNHLEPNLDDRDNLFTYDNTDDGDGWWTRVTHHVDGGYYGYPYDYHDFPDRFLNRIAEYGGGSPCGGVVYKEDAWPEKYRGRAIWAEWGKRKVSAFAFEPEGASFKIEDVIDLAEVGDSGELRPLDLALSYDGKTLYVADWGMGSWGSKTEKVGRVYAITYGGPEIPTRPRGADSDPVEAQIEQMDHPSFNERMRAQRALVKKGRDVLPVVVQSLADPKTDPVALRHLVWVVDGIAGATPDASVPLMEALKSPVADVRAQAARALGERRVPIAKEGLIGLLGDPEPSVKLQAIIALGRIGDPSSIPALLPILVDSDRYLAFSTRQALRRIGDWKAVASGLKSDNPALRAAILATLELVYDADAVKVLRTVATSTEVPEAERARAIGELATVHRKAPPWDGKWWGTRPSRGKAPGKTIAWEATPEILQTIETSLSDPALPVRLASIEALRETDTRGALPMLRERFEADRDPAAREAIALALGKMADKEALPILIEALRDPSNPPGVRSASLMGVETIGGREAIQVLIEILQVRGEANRGDAQTRAIAALGRFKAREAIPSIVQLLADSSPEVRAASAEALGQIGVLEGGSGKLREALTDPSVEVRKAVISALASLKDREAIPALLKAADEKATSFEATLALASLPDPRALQVYLRGLTATSPDLRKAASLAISAIRTEVQPVLDQLATRHELDPETLPELRRIYSSLQPILDWHVMGPFPFKDRPPVSPGKPVDLALTVPGPDGTTLSWKAVRGSSESGMVDLSRAIGDLGDRSAFGYAEFESPTGRPARIGVGSDDTLMVWLNGKEVYRFNDSRGFSPDVARVDVDLKEGKNTLLIKCGNGGGPWAYSVAVSASEDYAFLRGPSTLGFDPERFKMAGLKGSGQAERGKVLFFDMKGLACVKCHVVGGQGGAVGPELSGVAVKYPREELVNSILFPSARISSGYEPVVVAIADGRVLTGLIKSDTDEGLEIEDADAKRIKIPKADIEVRKASDVSLMPNGIVEGITPQDFADLIAYLETLKDAAANQAKPGGK
ncbi:HEAT repeat domain-containing protein [Tundrisphaera lichenicola]|uniref:HEAT repeat domain-containing protein n=1 Tax=Tundrisphaera lichenicola TaxID=2029860 RepID=UPI003EBF27E2